MIIIALNALHAELGSTALIQLEQVNARYNAKLAIIGRHIFVTEGVNLVLLAGSHILVLEAARNVMKESISRIKDKEAV